MKNTTFKSAQKTYDNREPDWYWNPSDEEDEINTDKLKDTEDARDIDEYEYRKGTGS